MLKISGVYRSFGTKQVLTNINLEAQEGEHFFLLGPSGCGKTTLLKIIAGLISADSGNIALNGTDITFLKPERRPVHTVFQHYALFPHLDVRGNIAFGLKLAHVPAGEIGIRVREVLELVKLSGYENRAIDQLSGGEQQRVAIARALVNKPKLLLLDEPLSAVDEQLKRQLLLDLKEIKQKIKTIFIHVTHNQEEALALANRIAVMNKGEIMQIGTPEEIYRRPQNMEVAAFIGRTSFLPIQVDQGQAKLNDGTSITLPENAQTGKYKAMLAIRPENVQLNTITRPTDGLTTTIRGKVHSRLFSGNMVELLLDTGAGPINALCTFEHAASLTDKQDIEVSWEIRHTLLFREPEEQ
jgi:spermidine/putrescine transport system ATP-binding protein